MGATTIFIPVRFIEEPIEVFFIKPPLLEKAPGCPDRFSWREVAYKIDEKISEWHDYQRKGRMARNMTPEHTARAGKRGSWGVGLTYFRVRASLATSVATPGVTPNTASSATSNIRIFDLYYDRAPRDIDHRKGGWFIFRELIENDPGA